MCDWNEIAFSDEANRTVFSNLESRIFTMSKHTNRIRLNVLPGFLNFVFRRQKSVQEAMQNLRRRLFKSIALLLDSWRYLAS